MAQVDIIIPAYNAAHYLPMALDSVLAQTFTDWRILLIDDGSQDATAEIASGYAARLGPKMLYLHQENRGLPAARNTGLAHATAELIAILDADDVWLPCRLEESAKRFEGHPEVGLSYGATAMIDTEGRVTRTFLNKHRHAEGKIAPWIYMRDINLPCCTITFRRRCTEELGGFDETLKATEDRDLWLRIATRYEVAYVPRLIGYYRVSPGSMSRDPQRMSQAQIQFVEKNFGLPGCGWRARRIALGWIYREQGEAFSLLGRRREAAGSAVRAFLLYPLGLNNLRSALSLVARWLFAPLFRRTVAA